MRLSFDKLKDSNVVKFQVALLIAICGGVGGGVFVTLGANGTVCAYKMLAEAKTIDVLTKLRNDYKQDGNMLARKAL